MMTLIPWRETASAIAEGLGDEPVDWLDEPEIVPNPALDA